MSPAPSVMRLHVEIRVTDTEAMATRELHQVLSNFVHFSSSEMIHTVKPRVHWSRWVRKVVLSLGYFRWWCSGHHRTCLWSQARRSACVRKHWWGWLNEGVETRRFLLSVLGGTIRPSWLFPKEKPNTVLSFLIWWLPFPKEGEFLLIFTHRANSCEPGLLDSDTMMSTCSLLSSLTMTAVFRASCTPCRWHVRPGIIALPFQVFSRRPVCFTFLSIPFVQTYRSGLHPKPHALMQWS